MKGRLARLILDYHMHLVADDHFEKCPYTVDRVRLYVEKAKAAGVQQIGITEHCNRFVEFKPVMGHLTEGENTANTSLEWLKRSFNEDLSAYVDMLQEAKAQGLPVKASIEADYIPGYEEQTKAILDRYPFDYVLGSVHFLGNWGIDISPENGWPTADVDQAYLDYFRTMEKAISSGLFDVMAHPDLIKKFGHVPSFPLDEVYDSLARTAAEAGVAMEISSAGLFKDVGEAYPSLALLKRMFEHGVPITLGSDAHEPDHVGRALDQMVELAKEAGYTRLVTFSSRTATLVPMG